MRRIRERLTYVNVNGRVKRWIMGVVGVAAFV